MVVKLSIYSKNIFFIDMLCGYVAAQHINKNNFGIGA
jgi:hypothetical protein